MIRSLVLVSLVVLAGCAASPDIPGSSGPTSTAPAPVPVPSKADVTPSAAMNPLYGTWRRMGSCTAFVEAMQGAGLVALIGLVDGKWMAGGVTPAGTDPTAKDYCTGAIEVEHSHFFRPDGQFGSYDELGKQVDDGTYELVGSDAVRLGQVLVRYEIDSTDHLRFTEVTVPSSCTGSRDSASPDSAATPSDCSQDHGWALSAFYPGAYERVPS
jgi:hypothetical protein